MPVAGHTTSHQDGTGRDGTGRQIGSTVKPDHSMFIALPQAILLLKKNKLYLQSAERNQLIIKEKLEDRWKDSNYWLIADFFLKNINQKKPSI